MIYCEDFPCCGHAQNECPTGPAKKCLECARVFEPTSMNSDYCLACGSQPFAPKITITALNREGKCRECGERDRLFCFHRGNVEVIEPLCEGCADDYGQAASDDAQDRRLGLYD